MEDNKRESIMCAVCGGAPCNWIVYGDYMISETWLEKLRINLLGSQHRYYIYEKNMEMEQN